MGFLKSIGNAVSSVAKSAVEVVNDNVVNPVSNAVKDVAEGHINVFSEVGDYLAENPAVTQALLQGAGASFGLPPNIAGIIGGGGAPSTTAIPGKNKSVGTTVLATPNAYPAQVALPPAGAPPSFFEQNKDLVLFGGIGVGLIAVLMMMKK